MKILIILIFTILLLCSSTKEEPEKIERKPFDPEGQCWYPPTVIAMDDTTVLINDTVNLHASYRDENGYVTKYIWALDGVNFSDTTDSLFKTVFTSEGIKKIKIKCFDNLLLPSRNTDSVFITVVSKKPNIFTKMKNKTLGLID